MMTATNAPPAYVASPQPVGQQQLVTVQPTPVTIGTVNPQPRGGNWKGIQWTGIIQVVLGSLTFILGIVTLAAFNRVPDSGDIASPIWCGIVFYGIAGICGILSGSMKNSGWAVGYMVMSILACLATCWVIGFGAARMSFINEHCYPRYTRYRYSYGRYVAVYDNPPSYCDLKAAVNGVYATLIVLALVEFVVAIVGASMTCSPLCSGGSATQTVIHYQARPHMVVTTQPYGPAFYNVPAGQPQIAYPAQQGQYPQAQAPPPAYPAQQVQYPQAQAPPTGEQQNQELIK